MPRRAAGALAAMLVVAGLALPAALLASQEPAAAAVSAADQRASQSLVSITISSMTPQWATRGSTITVSGTLRNTSGEQESHLTVQLLGSGTPVASVAQLELNASQPYSPATVALPGAVWQTSGELAPGATADWTVRVRASALGLTDFGVYPLAAQAQSVFGTALATATTYLPYEPARKSAYASSRPSPAKISWLWPLVDKPLLNEPWQDNCSGPQSSSLVQSLSSGRLRDLVEAGTLTQTTESWAAASGSGAAAADRATRSVPAQSLADYDGVTWVVDPALLANVQALATCQTAQPRWAKVASAWLADLKTATTGRPLTTTPYGDPNVAALIAVGHGGDVGRSFQLGRDLAGLALHRNLNPTATGGSPAALTRAAGVAWPTAGVPGYGTLENLANVDGVGTLVLSSSAFPGQHDSVLKTADGGGSYITALLASQALTELLGSANSASGSGFATAQQFLAETALLAQEVPSQPIVVAPPQRWDPPAGLAADLLADTATAPWLSPVELTSLASARHIQVVPTSAWPSGSLGQTPVSSKSELHQLRLLDRDIAQLESIRARPVQDLYLAVSAVESSAWLGTSKGVATAMLATLSDRLSYEQQAVKIIAEKRITLGGLKGTVPVSIDNPLGYAVRVHLQLQYSQKSGATITADPPGLITVAARTAQTVRLRVQAAGVGSTSVTLRLTSPGGQLLSVPQRMTIQATQVGVLGMIIFAAALGVFLIASAARAVRRGRPATSADQRGDDEPSDDHGDDRSAERAEPDTVMAERSELGAAGKPGP
jgi:hypothetical protein